MELSILAALIVATVGLTIFVIAPVLVILTVFSVSELFARFTSRRN